MDGWMDGRIDGACSRTVCTSQRQRGPGLIQICGSDDDTLQAGIPGALEHRAQVGFVVMLVVVGALEHGVHQIRADV